MPISWVFWGQGQCPVGTDDNSKLCSHYFVVNRISHCVLFRDFPLPLGATVEDKTMD